MTRALDGPVECASGQKSLFSEWKRGTRKPKLLVEKRRKRRKDSREQKKEKISCGKTKRRIIKCMSPNVCVSVCFSVQWSGPRLEGGVNRQRMHVTAAPSTNLESVPVSSSATHQQQQQSSTAEESGSSANASCKNNKKSAASGKRQQQRQHGNLDDEVRKLNSGFILLIDLLIKSLLVRRFDAVSLWLQPTQGTRPLAWRSTKDQSWLNNRMKVCARMARWMILVILSDDFKEAWNRSATHSSAFNQFNVPFGWDNTSIG